MSILTTTIQSNQGRSHSRNVSKSGLAHKQYRHILADIVDHRLHSEGVVCAVLNVRNGDIAAYE